MMTYFEVKARLENLTRFRNLYCEYIDFTNRPQNLPAQMVRQKMEPLVSMTVESLKNVGLGGMITRDAPVRGGRKVRINLIKAIFRDSVIKRFSLEDQDPISILNKGILKYQKLLWQQKLQLFNPLFWLYQTGLFLAKLPILIFKSTGYDTEKAEQLAAVKFYVVAFQILFFYLVADLVGVINWLRFDIIAL